LEFIATVAGELPKKEPLILDAIPGEFNSTNKRHKDTINRAANP
jgi:hypothetical protein